MLDEFTARRVRRHTRRRRARAALNNLRPLHALTLENIVTLETQLNEHHATIASLVASPEWISHETQTKRLQGATKKVTSRLNSLLHFSMLRTPPFSDDPFTVEFRADPIGVLAQHGLDHPPFQALLARVSENLASRVSDPESLAIWMSYVQGLQQGHGFARPLRTIVGASKGLSALTSTREFQEIQARLAATRTAADACALALDRAREDLEQLEMHVTNNEKIANAPRQWPQFAGARRAARRIRNLDRFTVAKAMAGMFVLTLLAGAAAWGAYSLLSPAPPLENTNGGGGGGGGCTTCLGLCLNETDCIFYRWGDFAIGIAAVDTPYASPHERIDPLPFQATLKVGGTSFSGGEYVYDFVRAPANTSLHLKAPFEYGGQVKNQYSTIGFSVPWSKTGDIYIHELLYAPDTDQVWAIVWLDGPDWVFFKFPWI